MKKAAEILARLLEKGPAGSSSPGTVFSAWQEIAGASLAEHCRVYEIRHGSLLVEADHPGWMQLLLLQKKAVLSRLYARFPQLELRDIKVRVNPAGKAGKSAEAAGTGRQPASADAERGRLPEGPAGAEVEKALESVADEGLKEKLRQLLREMERRSPPG